MVLTCRFGAKTALVPLTAARPGVNIGIVSNAATGTDPSVYWERFVVAFAANQLGDAIACAIPLAIIRRDLNRLGCPEPLQRALPVIKATSAAGLVLGTRWPSLGRLTAFSLAGYFLAAVGFHVRAGIGFGGPFLPHRSARQAQSSGVRHFVGERSDSLVAASYATQSASSTLH